MGSRFSAASIVVFLTFAASIAMAQEESVDIDVLWQRYDEQATTFEEQQRECDEGDIATTRVNRICREAADTSIALSDTIEALLEHDEQLTEEDRELLIDGMLTNRQIAGALWVELGECETGKTILQQLLAHPDLPARPVVQQASETWIARAEECIAEQMPVEEPVAEAPNRTAPLVVMSSGLAVLAAGVLWDVMMISEQNEFESLRDRCNAGCSAESHAELDDSAETLENAKVPIALLYGVGAATAVGGAVWYVVTGRTGEADRDVSLRPTFGAGSVGAALNVRF